ncbi:DUF2768 domain-containing protein [Lysinibacillus halotolerans]|uniref:DUF2768 domain-containing protein n=2 Tax=Bacilli TaxID=91061 RepID=A0A3M8H5A7_9BACI|nr:DUF2768 domain-containing protein [Lysinibacillus halotolerans]
MNSLTFLTARGPLASMHSLDVMWVSFYSIGAMLLSVLIVSITRKWVNNGCLSLLLRLIAFVIFAIGSILMILVVFTWPN